MSRQSSRHNVVNTTLSQRVGLRAVVMNTNTRLKELDAIDHKMFDGSIMRAGRITARFVLDGPVFVTTTPLANMSMSIRTDGTFTRSKLAAGDHYETAAIQSVTNSSDRASNSKQVVGPCPSPSPSLRMAPLGSII